MVRVGPPTGTTGGQPRGAPVTPERAAHGVCHGVSLAVSRVMSRRDGRADVTSRSVP